MKNYLVGINVCDKCVYNGTILYEYDAESLTDALKKINDNAEFNIIYPDFEKDINAEFGTIDVSNDNDDDNDSCFYYYYDVDDVSCNDNETSWKKMIYDCEGHHEGPKMYMFSSRNKYFYKNNDAVKNLIQKSDAINRNEKQDLQEYCFCSLHIFIFESKTKIPYSKYGNLRNMMLDFVC